jgi:cold-inducible RNA-binding protein
VNVYVGNLPFDATDSDLRALFTDYGTVDSASVIMDRESGRSRGFGFVELADEALAAKAISDLNGHDWRSRALKVNEARPRSIRS